MTQEYLSPRTIQLAGLAVIVFDVAFYAVTLQISPELGGLGFSMLAIGAGQQEVRRYRDRRNGNGDGAQAKEPDP